MKKKVIIIISTILIALLIVFIFLILKKNSDKELKTTTTSVNSISDSVTYEAELPFENTIIKGVKETLYVFYGSGCPHCAALHKYLEKLIEEDKYKNKFNVVYYEVWNNLENDELMQKVKEYTGLDKDGVPTYIIGDKIMYGYSSTKEAEIEATIDGELTNSNFKDVVEMLKNK